MRQVAFWGDIYSFRCAKVKEECKKSAYQLQRVELLEKMWLDLLVLFGWGHLCLSLFTLNRATASCWRSTWVPTGGRRFKTYVGRHQASANFMLWKKEARFQSYSPITLTLTLSSQVLEISSKPLSSLGASYYKVPLGTGLQKRSASFMDLINQTGGFSSEAGFLFHKSATNIPYNILQLWHC